MRAIDIQKLFFFKVEGAGGFFHVRKTQSSKPMSAAPVAELWSAAQHGLFRGPAGGPPWNRMALRKDVVGLNGVKISLINSPLYSPFNEKEREVLLYLSWASERERERSSYAFLRLKKRTTRLSSLIHICVSVLALIFFSFSFCSVLSWPLFSF